MKVSKSLIVTLQRLVQGETIAASSLRRDFADEFLAEGLLTVRANGSRRSFSAIDTAALRSFLSSKYEELRDMDNVMALCESDEVTRSEQAAMSGNSKLVTVRSCPGFPINSYEPISCTLNGQEFMVNPQEGSFIFVTDWKRFAVPADVTIVGIENMENFRMIRQQRALFEEYIGSKRLLLVSRYPQSTDLRLWLQTIPNPYIHFGDFDLAGINIFLTEFCQHLGERATFLIPKDIESRLKNGSAERYNDQYQRFHTLGADIPQIQSLIDLINKYHRCYDQEGYINNI